MKNWIRKIWDKFVALIYKIPQDKWLHFIAGVLVAAFFYITLGVEGCVFPALFAGIFKELFDWLTSSQADWKDLLATVIGGAVIQLFVII